MYKSLTAAGAALTLIQGAQADDAAATTARYTELATHDAGFAVSLSAPLNVNVRNMYAGHSSHSSHSSHASHASHSSGSGGSYSAPAYTPSYTPAYVAPTPAPAPAVAPAHGNGSTGTGNAASSRATADELRSMVMRVQAALYTRGFDPGAIDGVFSEQTKVALGRFQSAHGLPYTRSMTTATLNALGVSLGR